MKIKSTADFQEALRQGELGNAANWLEQVRNEPKYDDTWLDHRSRELMDAFCAIGNLDRAAHYINYAQTETGRQGRVEKIKKLKK